MSKKEILSIKQSWWALQKGRGGKILSNMREGYCQQETTTFDMGSSGCVGGALSYVRQEDIMVSDSKRVG